MIVNYIVLYVGFYFGIYNIGPLLLYLFEFSMIEKNSVVCRIISNKLPDPNMRLPVFMFRIYC